jgi:hypothetical protein
MRVAQRLLETNMIREVFFGALVLAVAGVVGAAEKPKVPSGETGQATNAQVVAYYFHGTVRCETCLKIEKQAREAMERRFAIEVYEKRLVFQAVNYDKPENAHFLKDYKLPCPSLVVVRQKGGKDEKWKLLDKTWEQVDNPIKFNEYVEGEVEKVLREGKTP